MKQGGHGHDGALEVVDAVMKRTGRWFHAGRLESDTCCSERLREKFGCGKGDGGGLEEGSVECGLQKAEAGVIRIVAAFVDGPRCKLRRIGDFLKSQ